jgi:hypothetical protein
LADPSPFADANSASIRNTLLTYWWCATFMGVAMVDDHRRLPNDNIMLNMNTVSARYQTPGAY